MLKKINEGGVKSDEFSIQVVGPELLEYKKDNYKVEIDVTYDRQKDKIYIYASDIQELNEKEK